MTDLSKNSFDKPNVPSQIAPCNQTPSTYAATAPQNVPSQVPEKESFWTWCCWCHIYLELKELHFESERIICCNCQNIFVATEVDVPEIVKLKASQNPDRFKSKSATASGSMQAPNSRAVKMTKREMLSGVGVSTKDGKGKPKKKGGLKKHDVGVNTKDGKEKQKKEKGGLKKGELTLLEKQKQRQMLMIFAKKEIMSKLKTWNTPGSK